MNAPVVTPADIEGNIASEHYFRAIDGAYSVGSLHVGLESKSEHMALSLLTFCVLVLRNGHTVTGEAFCQDPAKFDALEGRRYAKEDAMRKLWPMVVYAARCKVEAP